MCTTIFILTQNEPSRCSQELVVIFALLMLQHVVCCLLSSAGELTKESVLEIMYVFLCILFLHNMLRDVSNEQHNIKIRA